MKREIILASTSPRRQEQLKSLGLEFKVIAPEYQEDMEARGDPERIAEQFALEKAKSVAEKIEKGVVIAGDTFVVLGREKLGKPESVKNAREMLAKISGKTLFVISALAIIDVDEEEAITDVVVSKVKIKKIETHEIDSYVATGEPLDKAGAFAIQQKGACLVEKIEGDYQAIVGLPLFSLAENLRKFGITIF